MLDWDGKVTVATSEESWVVLCGQRDILDDGSAFRQSRNSRSWLLLKLGDRLDTRIVAKYKIRSSQQRHECMPAISGKYGETRLKWSNTATRLPSLGTLPTYVRYATIE